MSSKYLKLKQLLKEKKVTGKEMAMLIGMSERQFSFIVSGRSEPRLETLEQIARILEVDIRDLFYPTRTVDSKAHALKHIREIAENALNNR